MERGKVGDKVAEGGGRVREAAHKVRRPERRGEFRSQEEAGCEDEEVHSNGGYWRPCAKNRQRAHPL